MTTDNHSNEVGLELCPFCGATPKLIEIPAEVHYYVMCIECGACGSDLHGKQDAINAWNSRVSSAASVVDAAWKVAVEIANDRLGPRADAPQFWDKYAAYVKGIVEHHFAAASPAAPRGDMDGWCYCVCHNPNEAKYQTCIHCTAPSTPDQAAGDAVDLFGYERAITVDWDKHNARRHELIEAKRSRALSQPEASEFSELQWLAGMKRALGEGPPPAAISDNQKSTPTGFSGSPR